jgi:hypothetical protein
MPASDLSTIAQLLYPDVQTFDFARIVSDLEAVLRRLRGIEIEITWDCDDLVTFEVPQTRILLSWFEAGTPEVTGCLTIAVGPGITAGKKPGKPKYEVMCSRLVERIQSRFPADSVHWRQIAGPVDTEYLSQLMETLPGAGSANLPPIDSILDTLSRADLHMAGLRYKVPHPRSISTPELSRLAMDPAAVAAEDEARLRPVEPADVPEAGPRLILVPASMSERATVPDFAEVANDRPDLPQEKSVELIRLRAALYPTSEPEIAVTNVEDGPVVYSTQMRLAAHCLNATLIVVWAPLGAAVMTYSLLRGEDMRLSSCLMAVAGTLFALAHSPVGVTVAAMAKGLS